MLIGLLLFACGEPAMSQAPDPQSASAGGSGIVNNVTNKLFAYLNMAGTKTASDFRPLSHRERNVIYGRSLINPFWYFKGAMSGAWDLKNDKPEEWEQGASGYGKRVANIMGQYAIQRSVAFGLESLLHEDNRYFGSGGKGFWGRTGYAVSSSILARHDNGRRYPSVSQVAGFAAGAFLSRAWQPASTHTAGDAAVSFGISMGFNVLMCELKEFLPDIMRPLMKGPRNQSSQPSGNHSSEPAK